MSFDPNQYWLERGKSYASERRLEAGYYRDQERVFVDAVKECGPARILEAACGFGRVTKALAAAMPESRIEAFDLSRDQILNAPRLANVAYYCWDLRGLSLPRNLADVAVAAELFQHHPGEMVKRFITTLLIAAPVLIHDVNVGEQPGDPTAEHCFNHDWNAVYSGLDCTVEARVVGEHGLIIARRNPA